MQTTKRMITSVFFITAIIIGSLIYPTVKSIMYPPNIDERMFDYYRYNYLTDAISSNIRAKFSDSLLLVSPSRSLINDAPFEGLEAFGNLRVLHINSWEITEFPAELENNENLRYLSLADNKITEFPAAILGFKKLHYLDLSKNAISEIPKEISELTNLEVLDLSNNKIKEIPKGIEDIPNLEVLLLKNNQLEDLSLNWEKMENLKFLNTCGNPALEEIDDIPEGVNYAFDDSRIGSCNSFEGIFESKELAQMLADDLAQGNIYARVTDEMIEKTVSLSISGEEIDSIEGIGIFTNLEKLTVSGTSITTIPKEIENLKLLTSLSFRGNQIIKIPTRIYSLTNLEYLSFANNKVREIAPEVKNLTSLKTLNFSGNKIITVPKEISNLKKLKHLYLDENRIEKIPTEFYNMNLESLDICNNYISVWEIPKTHRVGAYCSDNTEQNP